MLCVRKAVCRQVAMSPEVASTESAHLKGRYFSCGPRPIRRRPFTGLRLFAFCHEEIHMLNTAITEYIAPSLPSRIDVELRIRLKR